MSVKRNRDGNITIKNDSGITIIGKIVTTNVERNQEKFEKWVEDCAKLVTPCGHTFEETIQYFLQQCDALPITLDDRRMKSFKLNVIMNHCNDKLEHQSSEFSYDMTDEEMEKWNREQDAIREEAMNSSPERFGLKMSGYYLPHTDRNTAIYEEAYYYAQKMVKPANSKFAQIQMQDICFFFEETTEHFQSSGGGNGLMNELIAFRGVNENDIKKRTPQFLGYITVLRDMGKLPHI